MTSYDFSCSSVGEYNWLAELARDGFGGIILHQLNVQRSCSLEKFNRLAAYVFSLSKKPLVLGFTETWFTSSETGELHGSKKAVRLYELEGYQSCFCSRVTRSAGVAVYIADGFGFEVLRKSDGEVSFVQVRINGRRGHYGDLYVTIMYMPRFGSYHEYFKLLEDLFLTTPFNCRHVIMGDFNIDVSRNTVVVREYRDLIESYGYELVNRSVTRSASSSVIDHVMTNRAGNTVYTVQNDISDHNGLFTVLHGTDSEPSEEEQMSLERYIFTASGKILLRDSHTFLGQHFRSPTWHWMFF